MCALGSRCRSNTDPESGGTTCLTLPASYGIVCFMYFCRVKDHHNLLHNVPLLNNACVRQVVSNKWFPLIRRPYSTTLRALRKLLAKRNAHSVCASPRRANRRRPMHAARIHAERIPGSRNLRASRRREETHPSKMIVSSGRTPRCQDCHRANRAQDVS